MTRDYSFRIYEPNRATSNDASQSVAEIASFTDTSENGETVSASITLDTRHGWHVSQGRPDDDGVANARGGVLDQFSLCHLSMTGVDGAAYSRYLEVRSINTDFTKTGHLTTYKLDGLEHHLKDVQILGHWFFNTYQEVIDEILAAYHNAKGVDQASFTLTVDNRFDLSRPIALPIVLRSGTSAFEALRIVIDRMRLPRASGGFGEFATIWTQDPVRVEDARNITLQLFIGVQGNKITDYNPVLDHSRAPVDENQLIYGTATNISSLVRTKNSIASNLVTVRGQAGTGTLPMAVAHNISRTEYWAAIPEFILHKFYEPGDLVRYQGAMYRCTLQHGTNNPSTSPYFVRDYANEYAYVSEAGSVNWTSGGISLAANAQTRPHTYLVSRNSIAYPDCNLVIRTPDVWQDWVHYTITDNAPPTDAANGTRILVLGTAHASLPANSSNAYIQKERDEWVVIRSPTAVKEANRFTRNNLITVLRNGTMFEWNYPKPTVSDIFVDEWVPTQEYLTGDEVRHGGLRYIKLEYEGYGDMATIPTPLHDNNRWERIPDVTITQVLHPGLSNERRLRRAGGALAWRDVTSDGIFPNHCWHYPTIVERAPSMLRLPEGTPSGYLPAVHLRYVFRYPDLGILYKWAAAIFPQVSQALMILGLIDSIPTEKTYEQLARSLTGEDIVELSNFRNQNLGFWYTLFEAPFPANGTLYAPDYLDLNNRNLTPTKQTGYTASDAEELDKLVGITFEQKFSSTINGKHAYFQGDYKFRCTIYDTESNVWIHDYVIRHPNTRQNVQLGFANFKPYAAREPITEANLPRFHLNPETLNPNVLNRRRIKIINITYMGQYDETGRFVTVFAPFTNLLETGVGLAGQEIHHDGTFENFAFMKAPLVIRNIRSDTSRTDRAPGRTVISPPVEQPRVANTIQLEGIAHSLGDLATHRLDNYTIRTPKRPDIRVGTRLNLVVNDIYGNTTPYRLAVTRVSHSYQADNMGFITEITAYRRINA